MFFKANIRPVFDFQMAALNCTILPRASAILKDIHTFGKNHLILNDDRFIEQNTSGGSYHKFV